MAGLIPFNRANTNLARTGTGFEQFYNMLDDFFNDGFTPSRSLLKDTFKIDIQDREGEYLVESEMPGINRDEIELSVDNEMLCISVNRTKDESKEEKSYVHRERRVSSMSRRVRLAGVRPDDISAKLENGILSIVIPKEEKADGLRRIDIA